MSGSVSQGTPARVLLLLLNLRTDTARAISIFSFYGASRATATCVSGKEDTPAGFLSDMNISDELHPQRRLSGADVLCFIGENPGCETSQPGIFLSVHFEYLP